MKPLDATIAIALIASAATAAASPATAPYNEAVSTVNGKRVVKLPPVPPGFLQNVKAWGKPGDKGTEGTRRVVETPDGLMDCTIYGFHPNACVPSTWGVSKHAREWVVLKDGTWQVCVGQAVPKACKGLTAFAFLPTVIE